ncbi:DUF1145 domain-containing protein [Pseudomonas sp.]|uniref:DUF1145 domain-containing protein n=1 Tax=Pseudomonas sp. TaxID=306 RepID=UPI0028A6D37E|nr:DUF1145 domain-containing protein [Pseudomonas sp.]
MNVMLAVGKALTVLFWGVVLFNGLRPQAMPFDLLIRAAGSTLLGLHVLEVLLFNGSLRERSHRWFDRLQILLTGIFHILTLPRPLPRR